MKYSKFTKVAGLAVLSVGLLSGCAEDGAVEGDYLTEADLEGLSTEEDLNTWAGESGFVNDEGIDAWAEEQGFTTEEDLNLWAEEEGLLDSEVTTETEEAVEGEEPAEEVVGTDVDLGAIDENELQTTYLEPLGWNATEFNDYVIAEYDRPIADFTDFAELETVVGPVEDIEVVE